MENQACFSRPEWLAGYELLGTVVIAENGCFRLERHYVRGVHPELSRFGSVRFVTGLFSGLLETEVTPRSGIRPTATFTVYPEQAVAA